MVLLGNIVREVRKSKKMSLAETADGIVTVPFLSKYERGEHSISEERFIKILDRLNITFKELESLIYDTSAMSQKKFLLNYNQALSTGNILLLNDLFTQEQSFFKKDCNIRHQHNMILITQYQNRLNKLPYDKKQTRIIADYLHQVSDWGYYELSLFGNFLFCLSPDTIGKLSKEAFQKASIYSKMPTIKSDLCLVLFNIIVKLLEQDDLGQIPTLFTQAENTLENTKFFYEQTKLQFLKGLYLIKMGNCEEGKVQAQKAIDIMQFLGNYELANSHTAELKKYLV